MNRHNFQSLLSRYPQVLRAVLLLVFSSLLAACGGQDVSDLETFIQTTKAKYTGNVESLPEIKPYESYRYHAASRDPFKPSVSLVKSISMASRNGIRPDAKRAKEDLEEYPLETLKMVGAMNNDGLTWGIIKAPDNAIYRVRRGNFIGQNHGKIIKIMENKIELTEIVADGMGGWIERPASVTLSE